MTEASIFKWTRSERGKYQEIKPSDGVDHSYIIDGFWLDPGRLWQSPRPRKSAVLAKLLGA